ncbi:MAG: DUF1566 domain-containing protein [Anaerolineales bacterium]
MRARFIITLLTVSILTMACGLTSSGVTSTEAPIADAPGAQENPSQPASQTSGQPEALSQSQAQATGLTYPIVDTDQVYCYDDSSSISCPNEGNAFYGQDAQYAGNTPRYQDNGDGTISDLVTGLMWQQDPGEKMTYDQAVAGTSSFNLAGYSDWRLPSIKELYSLIQFSGTDASVCMLDSSCTSTPFIDTDYFHFQYGDTDAGERIIDSQWATSSVYTGTVFGGQQAMFGVNFADGRIKGYPTNAGPGGAKTFFVIYVRGNTSYGVNDYVDNGNGTITDSATGLTWTQNDSGTGLDWEGALNYCTSLDYAGISDWRLPNAKELQSIVDYSRSPDATGSAAIDPVFDISTITNEAGQLDYPAFWSSTTHVSANGSGRSAVYVTFGRALGYMNGQWMDVHGAGAQRAEDKSGDPTQYPTGHGPQGDAVRIYNYVRCVTGGTDNDVQVGGAVDNSPVVQDQPPAGQAPQQGNGGQPPQAALDACSGSNQGAACTVDTPNGMLTGSCMTVQSGQLACVPVGGP